jgi:predicted acetyltransferase
MSLEIRTVSFDELPAFWRTIHLPFGERPNDAQFESWRDMVELDRTLAVFDPEEGQQVVATGGAYSFELTLPGGATLPAAGVTWVGVLPTHRRQGLLTALMRRQLEDVRARGEAIAVLTASESAIYGRFGYGNATDQANVEIDRRDAAFGRGRSFGDGRVRLIDHKEALGVLSEVYERIRLLQPGALSRSLAFWRGLLQITPDAADELGPRYYVMYTEAGGERVDGVAHYRIKPSWDRGYPAHTLQVGELLAVTPEAYAGLWRYLLSMDLVETIRAARRPVQEPLRWLLADPRRLRTTRIADELWIRLVDIPAALAARQYRASDRLVFVVSDPFRPEAAGHVLLETEAEAEDATSSYTAMGGDLALDVADLGAAYLGGVSFSLLAQAGRVVEMTPGAVARADRLFLTDRAPYCGTPF